MNEQKESIQDSKNIWTIIIIAVMITAIVVGGGIYVWQRLSLKSQEQPIQKQINEINNPRDVDVVKNVAAFFVREADDYVLYIDKGKGKEKAGLIIPVQKESYYDSDNVLKYRDLPFSVAVISPDGKKVAYQDKENPDQPTCGLYVVNVDGTNKTELTKSDWVSGHGAIGDRIFWDSNSENILYVDQKGDEGGNTNDLYRINIIAKDKTKISSESVSWVTPNGEILQVNQAEIVPAGFCNY